MRPGSYFLLQFGCAKNQVEGEHLAGMLMEAGWCSSDQPDQADLLLVNTCGFLQAAVEENLAAILDLAQDKRPGQVLAVVGCLVGRYGKKLARELGEVDLFLAPGEAGRLLEHLETPPPGRLAISRPAEVFGASTPRALASGPGWAYLRLSDGCGHRCNFCAIPAIRGGLRSRTPEDVLAEARALADRGVVELNLVAQDLLSYGQDLGLGKNALPDLLKQLGEISGLAWLRLLYLHPELLTHGLLAALAEVPKLLPYFDIPFQHSSQTVLEAMGRRGHCRQHLAQITGIRLLFPQAVLRTTLLVGHPGEGEAEFRELLGFLKEARFDHLGCFAYSPEPGTRSARAKAPAKKVAEQRAKQVMQAQAAISRDRLSALVGRTLPVLNLGPHPDSDLVGAGRLACQAPEVDGLVILTDGPMKPGSIQMCRIAKSHDYDLEGVLL